MMGYAMQKQAQQYQNHFLETEVTEATPYKLVAMLYEGGLKHLRLMRLFIERKNPAAKTEQVNKVTSILFGLKIGLDLDAGGDVAANMNGLYDYIIRQVMNASLQNDVAILDEAIALFKDLQDAWAMMPDALQQMSAEQIRAQQGR
jgi:flagellar protein FliS